MDEDPEGTVGSFRSSRKPWIVAIAANVILFGSLVLFPHFRGQARIEGAQERLSAFSACLWGGQRVDEPGLALPEGERDRFAAQVLFAGPEWPEACLPALRDIPTEEAMLLFPSVRDAEAQVREATVLLESELIALGAERRGGDTVSARAHRAIEKLLAALAIWLRAAGGSVDVEAHAFALGGEPGLPSPARVPLRTSLDAWLTIEARSDGIEAASLDTQGISWVRVGGGRSGLRRVRRPSLVQGLVAGPEGPWAVFSTPTERCRGADPVVHGCAGRSLGLRALDDSPERAPQPVWYASHPAGRPDRVVRIDDETIFVVAIASSGLIVRSFDRAAPERDGGRPTDGSPGDVRRADALSGEASAPRPAREERELLGSDAASDALLLSAGSPTTLFTTRDAEAGTVTMIEVGPAEDPIELATLPGARGSVLACESDPSWRVLSTPRGTAVVREGTVRPIDLAVDAPVGARPGTDALRIVCDASTADLVGRIDESLAWVRCGRDGCSEAVTLASGVAEFDAVREAGATIVAFHGPDTRDGVRVIGLDVDPAVARVVAACWHDPIEGFCGAPRLAGRGGRVLLVTREPPDLRVLSTVDGGATWRTMRGVR